MTGTATLYDQFKILDITELLRSFEYEVAYFRPKRCYKIIKRNLSRRTASKHARRASSDVGVVGFLHVGNFAVGSEAVNLGEVGVNSLPLGNLDQRQIPAKDIEVPYVFNQRLRSTLNELD